MRQLLLAEFFKLRQRPMARVLAGLMVAFIMLVYFVLLLVLIQGETQGGILPEQAAESERLLTVGQRGTVRVQPCFPAYCHVWGDPRRIFTALTFATFVRRDITE